LVSLAAFILASQTGLLRVLTLHHSAPTDPHAIDLGNRPDLVAQGPAGRRWCVAVPSRRICAVTGASESGRDALTRALRAQGYAVRVTR
jgi:hypothetical protein